MREQKFHIYLDSHERTILLHSLVELKNQLLAQGRYADCVDELIFKVTGAPLKKLKVQYDCGRVICRIRSPSTKSLSAGHCCARKLTHD